MPLVRISLRKGKSPEYLRALADGVHQSLVDAYGVPPGDRFQLIEQREDFELIYSADYLDIQRSDDVVFVHIIAGKWRDTATKKKLYKAMAENLAMSPGLRPEDLTIVLTPNERDEWSFGNGRASYAEDTR